MNSTLNGTPLVYGPVCWDMGDEEGTVFMAYYDPNERWNGFLCPLFPKAEADRIAAYNQSVLDSGEWDAVERITWSDADGAYRMQYADDDPYVIAPVYLDDDDEMTTPLYGIGSYGWTWMEMDTDVSYLDTLPDTVRDVVAVNSARFIFRMYPDLFGNYTAWVTDEQDDGVNFTAHTGPVHANIDAARDAALQSLQVTLAP